jgi:hypothetical protein
MNPKSPETLYDFINRSIRDPSNEAEIQNLYKLWRILNSKSNCTMSAEDKLPMKKVQEIKEFLLEERQQQLELQQKQDS